MTVSVDASFETNVEASSLPGYTMTRIISHPH